MYTRFQPILATILLLLMHSIVARVAAWKVAVQSVNIAQYGSSLPLTHISAVMQRHGACLSCHSGMTKAEKDLYGASGFSDLHVDIIAREARSWVLETRTVYRVSADFFSRVSRIARTEPAGAATLLDVSMGIVGQKTSKHLIVFAIWFLGLAAIYCLWRLAQLDLSCRRSRASYFSKWPTRITHLYVLLALVATAALVMPRANAVSASVIAAQLTMDAANVANSALDTSIQVAKVAKESAILVRRMFHPCTCTLIIYTYVNLYIDLSNQWNKQILKIFGPKLIET